MNFSSIFIEEDCWKARVYQRGSIQTKETGVGKIVCFNDIAVCLARS